MIVLRVAKENILKLQKMVKGFAYLGVQNAWMRANENGLYIETKNQAICTSIFLHIQPRWFSRFEIPDHYSLTSPRTSICFTISEFIRIVKSADPNLHHCIDISFTIEGIDLVDIDFDFKIIKFDQDKQSMQEVIHQRHTMHLAVEKTVRPLISIEKMLSINSAKICEADLNADEFIRAVQIAAKSRIKDVKVLITESCVTLTVLPCYQFHLFKDFGCGRTRLPPTVQSITCVYKVGVFHAKYLHLISPYLQVIRVRQVGSNQSLDLILGELITLRVANF